MTLDATVGGAASDSYVTLVEATALNGARINYGTSSEAARWTAASAPQQEAALKQATIDIDAFVRSGAIWDSDQRLKFPRAMDVDALTLLPFLPWRIVHATFEQASYLLVNQSLIEQAASRRARAMFSFDEPDVSGTISLDSSTGLMAPNVAALLVGYVDTTTGGRSGLGSVRIYSRFSSAPAVTQD